MNFEIVSPADWRESGDALGGGAAWTVVVTPGSRLESIAVDRCEEPSEESPDVAVLRCGVGDRMAELLNRLPPDVACLASPATDSDALLVAASAVDRMRIPTANRTPAEKLFSVARQGISISWMPVPADPADDACALPSLAPGRPAAADRWQLDAVADVVRSHPLAGSRTESKSIEAGLLQMTDWLDESHQASQAIEGEGRDRNGDYWHAIMHRREPDYGNSKYWFRHVGRHPIFPALAEAAGEVLGAGAVEIAQTWRKRLITRGQWDAFAFVDLCEEAGRDEASPLGLAARRIQFAEMLLLLTHTWSPDASLMRR
jgi:hypothetical protein